MPRSRSRGKRLVLRCIFSGRPDTPPSTSCAESSSNCQAGDFPGIERRRWTSSRFGELALVAEDGCEDEGGLGNIDIFSRRTISYASARALRQKSSASVSLCSSGAPSLDCSWTEQYRDVAGRNFASIQSPGCTFSASQISFFVLPIQSKVLSTVASAGVSFGGNLSSTPPTPRD